MLVGRSWGRILVMSVPSSRIEPPLGSRCPAIMFNTVDFPDPLGPTSVTSSPDSIRKFTSSTAVNSPKFLLTLCNMSMIYNLFRNLLLICKSNRLRVFLSNTYTFGSFL